MPWVKIDKDKPLDPGDIVELDFRIAGNLWLASSEIAMIEWQLAGRPDWEIISNSLPAAGRITFTVKVKDQAQGSWLQSPSISSSFVVTGTVVAVTVAKIAGAICIVSLMKDLFFLGARLFIEETVEQVKEISETAVEGVKEIAGTVLGKVAIGVIVLMVFKSLSK